MGRTTPVALVVAYDGAVRGLVGDWLEAEGYQVTHCPGPGGPEYQCVGTKQGRCPLAEEADVVVLDLWLETDANHTGAPSTTCLPITTPQGSPSSPSITHGSAQE